ncbi:hypothetical protein MXD81_31380 [Microbacteriaceae bacterium K1510]|nr:hypothetical protein [Microbacteriaceae bacterium K1510]
MEKNVATKHRNSNVAEARDHITELRRAHDAPNAAVERKRLFSRLSGVMPRSGLSSLRAQKRHSVMGRVSGAAAFLLVGYGVLWVTPGLINSSQQRALHRAAVHRDDSVIRTGVTPQFKTSVVLYYRGVNGTWHRLLADEYGVNKFVNETLIYLDTERERIKANTAVRIEALLATAFNDREASIAAYADWYFAWGRSWTLLKEACVGGLEGLAPNNVQGVMEASQNQVESYLIRHYQRHVLRPELRNLVLEAGIARILADAHKEYLAVVATLDDRVQDYLNSKTRALEPLDPLAKLDVSLGWDQQKWKAPRYAADDEAFWTVVRGTGIASFSALITKSAIERAVAPIFAKAASKAVTAMRPQIIGAAAGTMFEPGLGTAVGWVVGAGSGVAMDYLWDKGEEWLDRPEFERANAQALDATIQEWSRAIERDLFGAIDVWFEDTRAVVAEFKLRRKIPTG